MQFLATDEHGAYYLLTALVDAASQTTFANTTMRADNMRIVTESGEPVHRISKGVYELNTIDHFLMDRKIRLTSDDPDAP